MAHSDEYWNISLVARNEENHTFMWPTEKRVLFGNFIIKHEWQNIERALKEEKNLV